MCWWVLPQIQLSGLSSGLISNGLRTSMQPRMALPPKVRPLRRKVPPGRVGLQEQERQSLKLLVLWRLAQSGPVPLRLPEPVRQQLGQRALALQGLLERLASALASLRVRSRLDHPLLKS